MGVNQYHHVIRKTCVLNTGIWLASSGLNYQRGFEGTFPASRNKTLVFVSVSSAPKEAMDLVVVSRSVSAALSSAPEDNP